MADDTIKDCAELDAKLTPYVDGEDAPGEHRSVATHLSACPPCQQHANAEASAREYVHSRRDELRAAAPESLRARCALLGSQRPASSSPLPASRFQLTAWSRDRLAAMGAAVGCRHADPGGRRCLRPWSEQSGGGARV